MRTSVQRRINFLDFFTSSADLFDHFAQTDFIDCAHTVCRKCECHPAIFFSKPEAFFHHVWIKAALCFSGDFKTYAFLLFCNPADCVAVTWNRDLTGHLTSSWHDFSIDKCDDEDDS